jgi:tRNA threonylcarbamoyladenosine biosynthesis protein TsaE
MLNKKSIPLADIEIVAKETSKTITGGKIIALVGQLGSGKTTFTKALGKHLGIKKKITSPSFAILNHYQGKTIRGKKLFVYHLDLYRTKNWQEAKALGIEEIWLNPNNLTIIEWADKIKTKIPTSAIWLKFKGL